MLHLHYPALLIGNGVNWNSLDALKYEAGLGSHFIFDTLLNLCQPSSRVWHCPFLLHNTRSPPQVCFQGGYPIEELEGFLVFCLFKFFEFFQKRSQVACRLVSVAQLHGYA